MLPSRHKHKVIWKLFAKLVSENSLIKVVLEGEYKKDFDIDLYSLNSRLKERFFFAKVYDKTKFKVDIEDFKYDKTIKGEFVKTVFNSDLDDEEKNKVILLGLKALKGEEF